jgi:hypothetical protein
MEFRELAGFTRAIERIATDDELLALQLELVNDPSKGRLIQGTGGARKVRMSVRGRGKSGGARVIYYYQDQQGVVWMLAAYLKSEKSTLSSAEKQSMAAVIGEIRREFG